MVGSLSFVFTLLRFPACFRLSSSGCPHIQSSWGGDDEGDEGDEGGDDDGDEGDEGDWAGLIDKPGHRVPA